MTMSSIQGPLLAASSDGVSLESLAARARAGDDQSIHRVANEFESLFVSLVLKEMRQTLEPDTLFGGDTSDAYGGMFDLNLGQHIAKAGGFGIGKMVQEYLNRRKPESTEPAAAAADPVLDRTRTSDKP